MHKDKTDIDDPIASCIECGSTKIVERTTEQAFAYGTAGDQVSLIASMPVFTCADCGFEYFDERGEVARHAAVCRHLGVQTPEEICKTREGTGLTRAEFCHLSGFGSASLQRWESGMVVPNASSDRLIFLLRFPDNVERLKKRENAVSQRVLPYLAAVTDPVARVGMEIPEAHTRRSSR